MAEKLAAITKAQREQQKSPEHATNPTNKMTEKIVSIAKVKMEQQLSENERTKRARQMQMSTCSLIQICSQARTNVFEGDVLTKYGPGLNQNANLPTKPQLIHADLVDKDGKLTITINISNNLIKPFTDYFLPGKSVHIENFSISPKGIYERGDAKHCIILQETSTVQNIVQVCPKRTLSPDSTIRDLVASPEPYAVGSVAALVISCQRTDKQFELNIKDGNTLNDSSVLCLPNSGYKDLYQQIQQQLALELLPLYLFKNIVRSGPKGTRALRSSSSTFVDILNDDLAKAHILSFVRSNTQVIGELRAKNVFSSPFRYRCSNCKQLMLESSFCSSCKQITMYEYEHSIKCTLDTAEAKIDCFLQMPLLKEYCPAIADTSYEEYRKSISATVYELRFLHLKGMLTLSIDNIIAEIKTI